MKQAKARASGSGMTPATFSKSDSSAKDDSSGEEERSRRTPGTSSDEDEVYRYLLESFS